jgi:ATP-dependent Clp protease ATP-binding subunit ClpE
VLITENAIQKAVRLSKRYILDRYLPDKAIDLIDEAGARKSNSKLSKASKKKIENLQNKISKLEEEVKKAIQSQDYFLAADLRNEIQKKQEEIKKLKNTNTIPLSKRPTVDESDIEKVIAEKY